MDQLTPGTSSGRTLLDGANRLAKQFNDALPAEFVGALLEPGEFQQIMQMPISALELGVNVIGLREDQLGDNGLADGFQIMLLSVSKDQLKAGLIQLWGATWVDRFARDFRAALKYLALVGRYASEGRENEAHMEQATLWADYFSNLSSVQKGWLVELIKESEDKETLGWLAAFRRKIGF